MLQACGGGSDGPATPPPASLNCDSASVADNGVCRQFAERIDARATTPFVENGEGVTLEVVLFRPLSGSRHPLVMFNHGSTGSGSDPSLFTHTFTNKPVTQFFVERGFMVAFPQRRGRGQSDGLYDEGFNPDRSAYSCEQAPALSGAARALDDLDAATNWLRDRDDVDTTRMLVAGTSRGGILALAHAARRPDVYVAAINFVGGWIAEGCGDHDVINATLFADGAGYPGPATWLYGERDSFYSADYSRRQHDRYVVAGGTGQFHLFSRAAGLDGHFLINDPPLWRATVDAILAGL